MAPTATAAGRKEILSVSEALRTFRQHGVRRWALTQAFLRGDVAGYRLDARVRTRRGKRVRGGKIYLHRRSIERWLHISE